MILLCGYLLSDNRGEANSGVIDLVMNFTALVILNDLDAILVNTLGRNLNEYYLQIDDDLLKKYESKYDEQKVIDAINYKTAESKKDESCGCRECG